MTRRIEIPFEREIDGTLYRAVRVVEGVTRLRQVIHFRSHAEPDNETYQPGDEARMDAAARQILWALVTRGALGRPPF